MLRILRRFRRPLVAAAAAGVVAGTGFALVRPPLPTSTALVLLPPPPVNSAGQPTRNIATEVTLATSSPVLDAVERELPFAVSHAGLTHQATARAVTPDIIEIRASADTPRHSEALTNALAAAFVDYSTRTSEQATSGVLADLKKTAAGLNQQISELEAEIAAATQRLASEPASSPQGRQDASLIAALRNSEAALSARLTDMQSQRNDIESQQGSATGSSAGVLQPATPVSSPAIQRAVLFGVAGGLLLLVIGTVVVLVIARRDRRLSTRDDIADAVGQPVVASLTARPQRAVMGWETLLATFEPTTVDNWTLRRLLHHFGVGDDRSRGPCAVTVISLAGDFAGLAVGPQLATFAASLGVPAALSLAGYHTAAAALWSACTPSAPKANRLRTNLMLCDAGKEPPPDVAITVVVVVVDKESPQLAGLRATPTTVLSLTSGFATPDEVARLAVACDEAGRALDGVIVVNPDQRDGTTGFQPRHHVAPARRLPTRVAGIAGGKR